MKGTGVKSTLTFFRQDLGLIPRIHMVVHNLLQLQLKGYYMPFWPQHTLHECDTQTHILANTYI